MKYVYKRPSGRYQVQPYNPATGRVETIGTFNSEYEAVNALAEWYENRLLGSDPAQNLFDKKEAQSQRREDLRTERELYAQMLEEERLGQAIEAFKEGLKDYRSGLTPKWNFDFNHDPLDVIQDQIAVVASTADLHFGKRVWGSREYSREVAEDVLRETTATFMKRARRLGRIEKAYLIIGGDDLHFDNAKGSTTKGTNLELDGTPQEILASWVPILIEWINRWRNVAETVEVILTPGNHNEILSQAIALVVDAAFKTTREVTVITDPKPRKYRRWRQFLLGFSHGNDIPLRRLALTMPQEAPKDWGVTDTRLFFLQHEHHLETLEEGGVILVKQPSLSPADKWHEDKGFIAGTRATAYILHAVGGFTSLVAEV